MESYYYNSSTILKYLRKVLNEINKDYVDNGLRTAFIMKRYAEKYKMDEATKAKLVLLCLLKDIGVFYLDGSVDKNNTALAAASSYTFLKYCSPLGDASKPLLFYRAKYIDDIDNEDYEYGLLITLIDQVVMYVFQEYNLDEIESLLKKDRYGIYNPKQIKKIIKLLNEQEDILEKLNQKNSIFVYETSSYIQHIHYSDEELLSFIDMTNFAFEFHNHETLAHTVTTAIIARELAKLTRLTENQINCIYLAALVHDIGKIRVPIEILCNPGRLTGNDLILMRKHVEYTKEIIEGSFSYKICEIAGNHHEKLDGSGYPRGLRAIDLSIGDKIIAVADIASALYCKRSYKESMSEEQICAILKREVAEGRLEPRIVKHFIDGFEDIMLLARVEEKKVLSKYSSMKNEFNALKESKKLYSFFKYNIRDIDEEPELTIEEQLDLYDLHEPVDLEALVNATFDGIYLGNEDEEPEIEEYTEPEVEEYTEPEAVNDDTFLDEEYTISPTEEFQEEYYEEVEEIAEDTINEEYEEVEEAEEVEEYEEYEEIVEPVEEEALEEYEEEAVEEPSYEEAVDNQDDVESLEADEEFEDDEDDSPQVLEEEVVEPKKEVVLEDTESVLSLIDELGDNVQRADDDFEFEAFANSLQEKEEEAVEEVEEVVEQEEIVEEAIDDEFEAFANSLQEKEVEEEQIDNSQQEEEFEAFVDSLQEKEAEDIPQEEEFEAYADSLLEKNQEDFVTEEVDDEFEAFTNSLQEKEEDDSLDEFSKFLDTIIDR